MDKQTAQNIQDAILNSTRREKTPVTINLLDGTALNGKIRSFDRFSVLLDGSGQDVLIFKHAIATIVLEKRHQSEHN